MTEQVECHSGYAYAERPTALHWQGERLGIKAIVRRWRAPEGSCFKVQTEDGQIFELCYVESADEWRITPV